MNLETVFNNIASKLDMPDGHVTYFPLRPELVEDSFQPYELAPLLRPIVFLGPTASSSVVSKSMRDVLVKYLSVSFSEHVEVLDMSVAARKRKMARHNNKAVVDAVVTSTDSEQGVVALCYMTVSSLVSIDIFSPEQIQRVHDRARKFKVSLSSQHAH